MSALMRSARSCPSNWVCSLTRSTAKLRTSYRSRSATRRRLWVVVETLAGAVGNRGSRCLQMKQSRCNFTHSRRVSDFQDRYGSRMRAAPCPGGRSISPSPTNIPQRDLAFGAQQSDFQSPDGVSDAERNHFHRRNGAGLFTKPGSSTSRTQIPQPGVYGMLKAGRRKGAAWKGAQEVPRHVQEAVHANVTPLSRPLHSTR